MKKGTWSGLVAALAIVYFLAGRLGLSLDPVGGFATLVWPPAGVALAALLIFGVSLWPGVTIGAFLVNLITGAPIVTAAAIAAGNTLEAVIGAYVLLRVARLDVTLAKLKDVFALALVSIASPTVAATIGVWALTASGIITGADFGAAWVAWWLGDTVGILALTPLFLIWARRRQRPLGRAAVVELIALIGTIVLLSLLIFGGLWVGGTPFWQAYLLMPVLMWAALRLHQFGAVTSIFLVSAIAIWGTVLGLGPFTNGPLHARLQELQIFMAVTTLTFLVLGVASAERKAAETQLIHAKELAEAASRAKSQFLAVTSHELRTPLTGIVGYADLLEAGIAGPLSEEQRAKVARIKAAAWHLVGIIENILSFSRAEAGREEVVLERLDAVAVARAALALVEPAANAKGVVVSLRASHDQLELVSDGRKISQILVNVLGNAVKFTDRGSIDLEILSDHACVEFRIRDDGSGIPHEHFNRIFEPFTQVDQSATRAYGGTGLGLAVARAFTEMLGGAITVQSTVGSGSTFTVRLPVRRVAPVAERDALR